MKKVILGGLLFIGGAIMYSIGTLGFADMDVQANYMLTPQYIGIVPMEYIMAPPINNRPPKITFFIQSHSFVKLEFVYRLQAITNSFSLVLSSVFSD